MVAAFGMGGLILSTGDLTADRGTPDRELVSMALAFRISSATPGRDRGLAPDTVLARGRSTDSIERGRLVAGLRGGTSMMRAERTLEDLLR